jgi:ABC-type transport system involved in cytochrome bd biosynthesis fused ATPase/permease subunit
MGYIASVFHPQTNIQFNPLLATDKMKIKLRIFIVPSLLLTVLSSTGCSSSFLKKTGTDIAIAESYDQSYEKKTGMTEWEYEQKIKRDQEQREEEQRQFNSMRNQ